MGSFAVSFAASFDSSAAANVPAENKVVIKANVEIFFMLDSFYVIILLNKHYTKAAHICQH